jgi:hypothetical protein
MVPTAMQCSPECQPRIPANFSQPLLVRPRTTGGLGNYQPTARLPLCRVVENGLVWLFFLCRPGRRRPEILLWRCAPLCVLPSIIVKPLQLFSNTGSHVMVSPRESAIPSSQYTAVRTQSTGCSRSVARAVAPLPSAPPVHDGVVEKTYLYDVGGDVRPYLVPSRVVYVNMEFRGIYDGF